MPASCWARLPPSTNSMREVGPAVVVADVVDLHDVRVPQSCRRLGFPEETLPLFGTGVCAGQQHLEGDGAVEPQVPGLVDDPHAAVAQKGLHVIAGIRGNSAGGCAAGRPPPDDVDTVSGNKVPTWASTRRSRLRPSRTCGSNSAQSRQTSSGDRSVSRISSSRCCTRGSPPMTLSP